MPTQVGRRTEIAERRDDSREPAEPRIQSQGRQNNKYEKKQRGWIGQRPVGRIDGGTVDEGESERRHRRFDNYVADAQPGREIASAPHGAAHRAINEKFIEQEQTEQRTGEEPQVEVFVVPEDQSQEGTDQKNRDDNPQHDEDAQSFAFQYGLPECWRSGMESILHQKRPGRIRFDSAPGVRVLAPFSRTRSTVNRNPHGECLADRTLLLTRRACNGGTKRCIDGDGTRP